MRIGVITAIVLAESEQRLGFWARVEHFREAVAVSFQALESSSETAARASFSGFIGSLTRPRLEWPVDYNSSFFSMTT